MPKYTFPLTEAQFRSTLNIEQAKKIFPELGDVDDPITFAYSCFKMGWMNKQYHKETQEKNNSELRTIRAAMKKDPSLRAKLLGHDAQKGVK